MTCAEEAVVGPDEEFALAGLEQDRVAVGADLRIDHGDEDRAGGKFLRALVEQVGALGDVEGRDGVGEVEEARVGIDGEDHALELRDVGIVPAVIGEEADGGQRRGAWAGERPVMAKARRQSREYQIDESLAYLFKAV